MGSAWAHMHGTLHARARVHFYRQPYALVRGFVTTVIQNLMQLEKGEEGIRAKELLCAVLEGGSRSRSSAACTLAKAVELLQWNLTLWYSALGRLCMTECIVLGAAVGMLIVLGRPTWANIKSLKATYARVCNGVLLESSTWPCPKKASTLGSKQLASLDSNRTEGSPFRICEIARLLKNKTVEADVGSRIPDRGG